MEYFLNFMPLIVSVATLGVGVMVYGTQKRIDRTNDVKKERRTLYRDAAVVLEKVHQGLRSDETSESEALELILELEIVISEIQVTAPDEVADAWLNVPHLMRRVNSVKNQKTSHVQDFDEFLSNFDELIKEYERGRANILVAMRRDNFPNTKITITRIIESLAEIAKLMKTWGL